MNILWRLREASVREVQQAIVNRKRPAYTIVQTVLLRLEEKGAIRKTRRIGNAFMFEPPPHASRPAGACSMTSSS